MKIDNISHLPNATRIDQGKGKEKVGATAEKSHAQANSATNLSGIGSDDSHDIDAGRVAELRQAIADGRLKINPDRIADRLIASARDLTGK